MKRYSRRSVCVLLFTAVLALAQSKPSTDKPPSQSGVSGLPLNFERHTGDLDDMMKRGSIRALVLYLFGQTFGVQEGLSGVSFFAKRAKGRR